IANVALQHRQGLGVAISRHWHRQRRIRDLRRLRLRSDYLRRERHLRIHALARRGRCLTAAAATAAGLLDLRLAAASESALPLRLLLDLRRLRIDDWDFGQDSQYFEWRLVGLGLYLGRTDQQENRRKDKEHDRIADDSHGAARKQKTATALIAPLAFGESDHKALRVSLDVFCGKRNLPAH